MILTEKQASKMNMYIPRKKKQSKQKYFCMRNKDEMFSPPQEQGHSHVTHSTNAFSLTGMI